MSAAGATRKLHQLRRRLPRQRALLQLKVGAVRQDATRSVSPTVTLYVAYKSVHIYFYAYVIFRILTWWCTQDLDNFILM